MNKPVVTGTPTHHGGVCLGCPFDQYLLNLAKLPGMALLAEAFGEGTQPGEAFVHNLLGHLILKVGGNRSGALGILKGEGRIEGSLFGDTHGVFKILITFTGEAHDDVR